MRKCFVQALCELQSTNPNISYCYWYCQARASQASPPFKERTEFQIVLGNAKRKKNPVGGGKPSQSKLSVIYYHE